MADLDWEVERFHRRSGQRIARAVRSGRLSQAKFTLLSNHFQQVRLPASAQPTASAGEPVYGVLADAEQIHATVHLHLASQPGVWTVLWLLLGRLPRIFWRLFRRSGRALGRPDGHLGHLRGDGRRGSSAHALAVRALDQSK